MEPILEIKSLKKYYGKAPNQTKALNGINLQVIPGEFLGIMGSSGSGKSTLRCMQWNLDRSAREKRAGIPYHT